MRRSFSLTRRRGSVRPLFYECRFQVAGRHPVKEQQVEKPSGSQGEVDEPDKGERDEV